MIKNPNFLFLTILFVSTILFSCSKEEEKNQVHISDTNMNTSKLKAETMEIEATGLSKTSATIKTVHGNIVFKFYPKESPNTVNRIIELINSGFYNGISFHRVIPGFVIQGGDPTGTGRGGSGKNLKAEFNSIKHKKGVLGMARGPEVDSADSQFYITLGSAHHLDGQYTVFGEVIEGMDVAEKIGQHDKMISVIINE